MAQAWRNRKKKTTLDDERRFTVRGVRRDPLDIEKLSKALIGLALAEAERQAQAEHSARAAEGDTSEITSDGAPHRGGESHG